MAIPSFYPHIKTAAVKAREAYAEKVAPSIEKTQQTYRGVLGPHKDHPHRLVGPFKNKKTKTWTYIISAKDETGHECVYRPHKTYWICKPSAIAIAPVDQAQVPVLDYPEGDIRVVAPRVGGKKLRVWSAVPIHRECTDPKDPFSAIYQSAEEFDYGRYGFIRKGNAWVPRNNPGAEELAKQEPKGRHPRNDPMNGFDMT